MAIADICKKYTNLSASDINELKKISDILPTISELVKADVFLDCPTKDHTKAIVVAEAKPTCVESNYMNSVVGKIALQENEPAALRTLNTGVSTRGLKAITQENKTVIQTTVPVRNKKEEVIAVLIIEQAVEEVFKEGDNINKSTLSKSLKDFPEVFQYMGQNLNFITQSIDDSIIIFDKYGIAIYANPCAKKLYRRLGYKDSIIGMKFNNLVLDQISFEEVLINNYIKTPEVSAGKLNLEIKYSVMKQKGKLTGVNMIIKDITEAKEKEKELILKSVAIKEMHHRVKNNL
ncbi:MAG: histidine kinase N-terminal domain-containing protein [Thermotaleaceae bacterium]